MGLSASKHDDPLRSSLVEDPELQSDQFPNDQGRRHLLKHTSRIIAYEIYGDEASPAARTILFMHGTPGTRFFFSRSHAAYAATHNVRVLVPERPGFGLSTPFPERTLETTASDTASLMDELDLEKVHVVGYSAGGPYALAFGRWHPSRCASVTLISSLSPNVNGVTQGMDMLSKFGYFLSANFPNALRRVVRLIARQSLSEVFDAEKSDFTEAENAVFSKDLEIRRLFAKSQLELYSRHYGSDSEAEDYVLMARDWGFQLSDICGDFDVHVYGGDEDIKCTMGMYRVLVEQLDSKMVTERLGKGENHLWFYSLFEQELFKDIGLSHDCKAART